MARQHKTSAQLLDAQTRRFSRVTGDARRLHEVLARGMRTEALGLLSGQPEGRARMKFLRDLGHPYGRGPAPQTSSRKGGQGSSMLLRGVTPAGRRRAKVRGAWRLLPIGVVSGRLKAGMRLWRSSGRGVQTFALGAPDVDYARFILHPAGTRWMVGRNFWSYRRGSVPGGEMGRRWRIANRALIMRLRQLQRRP